MTLVATILTFGGLWFVGDCAYRYLGTSGAHSKLEQFFVAVLFGWICVLPFVYIVAHWLPLSWYMLAVICVLLGSLLRVKRKALIEGRRVNRSIISVDVLVYVLPFALVLFQLAGDSITSGTFPWAGDYQKHDAVLLALKSSLLPPSNPFFHFAGPTPLSYYYFYHLVPACVLSTFQGLSSANVFAVFAATTFAGMLATLRLCLQHLFSKQAALLACLVLIFVGEYKAISAFLAFGGLPEVCSTSWLQCYGEMVMSRTPSFSPALKVAAWMPHHLFAVAVFLVTTFVWLSTKDKKRAVFFSSVALVSLAGSSVYFSVYFATICLLTIIFYQARWRFVLPNWTALCGEYKYALYCLVGAGILVAIFAIEIFPDEGASTSGLGFGLRWPVFAGTNLTVVSSFMVMYLLSFGGLWVSIFLLGGRKVVSGAPGKYVSFALVTTFLISTFVYSTGSSNDFGYRTFFIHQIVVSSVFGVAAARAQQAGARYQFVIVVAVFLLPILGSLTHAAGFGPYRLYRQVTHGPEVFTQELLDVGKFIRNNTSKDELVLGPVRQRSYLLYFTQRQSVYADIYHGRLFNVSPHTADELEKLVKRVFVDFPEPSALDLARDLGADVLVVPRRYLTLESEKNFGAWYANKRYLVMRL